MTDDGYHASRFPYDPRRRTVWRTLVACFFQDQIGPDDTVLDLGAGYGEFINAVCARKRIAVDLWDGMLDYLDDGVEGLVTGITQLDGVADGSVDYVFSSNCFEHVPRDKLLECLDLLKRKMKKGAVLSIVQPNFRYCFREYFDDYTHVDVYTDRGLVDLLTANGFEVTRRMPRFLPLSMKSRLPVCPLLVRLYVRSPFKPLAKQMLIQARR